MKYDIIIKRIDENKVGADFQLYKKNKYVGKVSFHNNWIESLIVLRDYQRRGYARLLMNILLSEFGNRNIKLLADGDDNYCSTKDLVKFYRSFGFRGHKKEMYGGIRMIRKGIMLKEYKFKL